MAPPHLTHYLDDGPEDAPSSMKLQWRPNDVQRLLLVVFRLELGDVPVGSLEPRPPGSMRRCSVGHVQRYLRSRPSSGEME